MPPQQPSYPAVPPPAQPQSQYEFIMNPQAPQKKPKIIKGGTKTLLLVLAGAAAVVLVLVIFSTISKSGGESKAAFITIEQEQQEMQRVAALQSQSLTDQTTKNFIVTTQLSLMTDQAQLSSLLKKHGVSVSGKLLAAGMNSSTDLQLTNAMSTSTLDPTLKTIMQQELTDYKTHLTSAYDGSKSPAVRAELKTLYNNATLLLTQSQG